MPDNNRKLRVFLCHASQDKPIVRELYQRLNAEGWIDPWLDEEKLLPGQDWDLEIEKAVRNTDAVVVCLSTNSYDKEGYVQQEMRLVLRVAGYKPENTIFIIPIRLDDCDIPMRLELHHFVDFFPLDRKDWAYSRLFQSLKIRLEQVEKREAKEKPKVQEDEIVIPSNAEVKTQSGEKKKVKTIDEQPEYTAMQIAWQDALKRSTGKRVIDSELNRAREELANGNINQSLQIYDELISKKHSLNFVISDLREALSEYPVAVKIWQSLGDAYMAENQLENALACYSQAEHLLK